MHTPHGLRLDELYLTLEWYIVSYFSSGTVTKNHVTNLRMLRLCKIRRVARLTSLAHSFFTTPDQSST
jgi:hypothetical protein